MASVAGRGAQVRLDGADQAAARGALAATLDGNTEAKRVLEFTGVTADGSRPDGSTLTGLPAGDEVLTPGGVVPAGGAEAIAAAAAATASASAASTSQSTAAVAATNAAAARGATEAALAVANLGYVGPLVTAGGFHFTEVFYTANGYIVAGFDLTGRFLCWDGTTFGPVSPSSAAGIASILGYTPANQADIVGLQTTAGYTGPLVTVGGYHLVLARYDTATGRLVGGITVEGYALGVVDDRLAVLGSGGGSITANAAPTYTFNTTKRTLRQTSPARMTMMVGGGQSLAAAIIGATPGDAVFTTTALDPGFSFMFNGGTFPIGTACTSLVDLKNSVAEGKETAGPRMFGVIQARLLADTGSKQPMLWSVSAASGQPYSNLKRGTATYAEMLRQVERGAALAKAQALPLYVPGIWWRHGEEDTYRSPQSYAADMVRFQQDLSDDIRAITGQREIVRLFLTQPARGSATAGQPSTSALGMLLAADLNPHCVMLGPIYYITGSTDDTAHPTAYGYVRLAETSGHALADYLTGPGFVPVRMEDCYWSTGGATPQITLRYSRPVVIDTSGAAVPIDNVSAAGFDFLDGASTIAITATTAVPASTTAVVSGNTITLGPSTTPRNNGDTASIGLAVTVDGVRYDLLCEIGNYLSEHAASLAALIPGATSSGAVVTVPGATTIVASVASSYLRLTLASAPALRPQLIYAGRSTAAVGGFVGQPRGLVREWRQLGVSAVPGSIPLNHWACVEARNLPKI